MRQLPGAAMGGIVAGLAVIVAIAISLASGTGSQEPAVQLAKQRLVRNCGDLTKVTEDQGYTVQIDNAYAAGADDDASQIVKVPVTTPLGAFSDNLQAVFTVGQNGNDVLVNSGDRQTFRWYAGCLGADSVVNGRN
ncbi:hypothetical protein [Streptomyces sp. NPDC003278]|uniref:hypothetical protein n=1 Tax=Streptomyces sp. NPDC003278 TaxID=3364679 RepID=UPI0036A3D68E